MDCPEWLWVRVAFRTNHGPGQIWWGLVQAAYRRGCPLEKISWEELCKVFYNQFFFVTVFEEKLIEFMALT